MVRLTACQPTRLRPWIKSHTQNFHIDKINWCWKNDFWQAYAPLIDWYLGNILQPCLTVLATIMHLSDGSLPGVLCVTSLCHATPPKKNWNMSSYNLPDSTVHLHQKMCSVAQTLFWRICGTAPNVDLRQANVCLSLSSTAWTHWHILTCVPGPGGRAEGGCCWVQVAQGSSVPMHLTVFYMRHKEMHTKQWLTIKYVKKMLPIATCEDSLSLD